VDATDDIEMVRGPEGQIPLQGFTSLREECPAVRQILVPDEIWPQFREWHSVPDDVAGHSSIVLLAFRRGYLPRVTGPIHRHLMSSDGILGSVSKQYLKDLREKWMFDADPVERNRLSRTFRGRLIELQFASWLEDRLHTIVGLEATREVRNVGGPDIQTVCADGQANSFEVKFIGTEDSDFEMLLRSMGGYPAGGAVSAYRPINYLLFRVYEAARQLTVASGKRNVVVVIDELAWHRFDVQVNKNWIDWSCPQFIYPDHAWNQFLSLHQKRYCGLPADLATTIREVASITVYVQNHAFEFRQKAKFSPGA
jgi:hypothetical protein